MSYIIKSTQPYASTKLTELGREKLAKGQLTFSSWAIGDSEVNYNREIYVQGGVLTGNTSMVLRPKDRQPNLKYFINTTSGTNVYPFGSGDVRCIKLTVNNEAEERGHFTGNLTTGFTTNTTLTGYTRTSGSLASVGGGTSLNIAGVEIGDFILLKLGYNNDFTNEDPQPHLWFKAQNVVGSTVTVDRELPDYSSNITYLVYKGGNIYDNEPDAVAYWDTGTLSFDSSCDITTTDVPIWNMNVPFSEDVLGIDDSYERLINFGSYNYIGEKDNYLYNPATNYFKNCAIIHYSNKTISNLYGEFFYIDTDNNKTVKLHLPDLMYHRRNFGTSSAGDKMGMTFVALGTTISTGSNGLTYVPLVEQASLVNGTIKQVGRVYTALKIITIDDPEIVAAMSYKSNRNWTLPKLNLAITNPAGGIGTGSLGVNETMFVTYALDNDSGNGITPTLPCQDYATITNTTTSSKDVQFNIENVALLPYMQDNASSGGFYANKFKVLFQITNGERPVSNAWKEIDFTSSVDTGSFVDPLKLEIQNPNAATPVLQLTQANTGTATIYSLVSSLSMPTAIQPDNLQFGDERFFYGNVEAFIGATIFKTIFKVAINASDFNTTTNITRSNDITTNPPNIKVSEVAIYDSTGALVVISKLSNPVELTPGKTVILELSMDF